MFISCVSGRRKRVEVGLTLLFPLEHILTYINVVVFSYIVSFVT